MEFSGKGKTVIQVMQIIKGHVTNTDYAAERPEWVLGS